MINNEVFMAENVINKLNEVEVESIDFAFGIVALEEEIKSEIATIRAVITKVITNPDKYAEIEKAKLELQNNPSKELADKFNEDFKDDFKEYNESTMKINDILEKENKTEFTKLVKSDLPKGLTIADYRILYKFI